MRGREGGMDTHKLISLFIVGEERSLLLLLVLDKGLQEDSRVIIWSSDHASSGNTWMSTLKLSLVGHSADWVASSHFSKSRASRGKRGCLAEK